MRTVRLTFTEPQIDIFFPPVPQRHTIIPKGRRFGATRGASHACIRWCLEGAPILWGDTVHGNIERYWDRYFQPALKSNGIEGRLDKQTKIARIGDGYIDFRSADKPENWEGFGYRKVILNEAGLILGDPYLYTNAVRPMMIEPGSMAELYALGVPKGLLLSDGRPHPFAQLWDKVGTPGFRGHRYSSYDNPLLSTEDIKELEADIAAMDPEQVRQEIYGEFVQAAQGRPFAFNFSQAKHVRPCPQIPGKRVGTIVDFNVEPFCGIYAHIWTDHLGPHCHIFHEDSIKEGTLEEMARRIRSRVQHPSLIELAGDRGGAARRLGLKSNASMFADLIRLIPVNVSQLTLRPNPTHIQSREDVNYVLAHHPDFVIDPSCTGVIRDLLTVSVDEDGQIIKRDRSKVGQQADLLDCVRYLVNTFLSDFKRTFKRVVR